MRKPIPPQMLFAMRWAAYLKVHHDDDDDQPIEPADPNSRITTEDGDFITDEDGNRLIIE